MYFHYRIKEVLKLFHKTFVFAKHSVRHDTPNSFTVTGKHSTISTNIDRFATYPDATTLHFFANLKYLPTWQTEQKPTARAPATTPIGTLSSSTPYTVRYGQAKKVKGRPQ
jgi:hypothetical protein